MAQAENGGWIEHSPKRDWGIKSRLEGLQERHGSELKADSSSIQNRLGAGNRATLVEWDQAATAVGSSRFCPSLGLHGRSTWDHPEVLI